MNEKPSIYSALQTDEQLERNGVVLDFGEYGKFKIARAGGRNQPYNTRVRAALKPYQRQIDAGLLSDEKLAGLLAKPFAEHVVKGWEGVFDLDGNPIEYTQENAERLLLDLPELFSIVREHAALLANFRKEDNEAAIKNS
ncbi:MAG TPA: hypothetical protein VHK27_05745 [Gammaproteobacteria bacterium]|nr:hypothetical protein [Gammaproteobacteria bacterium]